MACGLTYLAVAAGCLPAYRADDRPPNVIIILVDDLGYADLGSYGAEGYETVNLDELAKQGMRFTQFYVPASACTPSRAALLTGRYPMRVGLPFVLFPGSTTGLSQEELTIAEILKQRGYATAAVGKWHLGDHPAFLPTRHGFDRYFGLPYSNDMSPDPANNTRERARAHPPLPLIRDTTIVEREPDQAVLTRRYTDEAVGFIQAHQHEPFFLYLAHTFPHVPLYASEAFMSSTERGLYGDVVTELDWSVGRIMETLGTLGLDEQTLVIFTSDNGPWLLMGDHGGTAGPLREGKATTFEGGHRVPAVMRWPGIIPAGSVSEAAVTTMDLLPTIAAIAGYSIPPDHVLDGNDIRSVLVDNPDERLQDRALYFYLYTDLHAVRRGRWKLHVPHGYVTLEGGKPGSAGYPGEYALDSIGLALFDLDGDVMESTDVSTAHPDVVAALLGLMDSARVALGDSLTRVPGKGTSPPGRVAAPWREQEAFIDRN